MSMTGSILAIEQTQETAEKLYFYSITCQMFDIRKSYKKGVREHN